MQTSVYEIEKHTDRKRYVVFLNAEYLLRPHKNIEECVVVNINPGGACIMFPPKVALAKGESLSLKIKNRRLEMIIVTGNIVWFKKIETACIAGVKFTTPLDINSYKKTLL
jgi:uncharacterized membrane protein